MSEKREVILSGIRPTGRLHYGNYFGLSSISSGSRTRASAVITLLRIIMR